MNPVLNKIVQAIVATLPLLMTPVLFYFLAEGILNLHNFLVRDAGSIHSFIHNKFPGNCLRK